jgi:hypothetical protein
VSQNTYDDAMERQFAAEVDAARRELHARHNPLPPFVPEIPGARPVEEVTDENLDLTEKVDVDTWVAVLFARGLRAHRPSLRNWPLLPERFIRARDEEFVIIPARPKPARPKRPKRPRTPKDVDALRAQRDRLIAERDRLWNATDPCDDTAWISIGRKHRARQRDRFDRSIDKGLALVRRIQRLDYRILDAEAWNKSLEKAGG